MRNGEARVRVRHVETRVIPLRSGKVRVEVYVNDATQPLADMTVHADKVTFAQGTTAKQASGDKRVSPSAPIAQLDLGVRAYNCLKNYSSIDSVEQLTARTEAELARIPGLGRVTLDEIKRAVAAKGLRLRQTD